MTQLMNRIIHIKEPLKWGHILSTYIDFGKENDEKTAKFKIDDN